MVRRGIDNYEYMCDDKYDKWIMDYATRAHSTIIITDPKVTLTKVSGSVQCMNMCMY